jgi:hypothetical protein
MKLPKIKIEKFYSAEPVIYTDGIRAKMDYRSGVRAKAILPEFGIVIKANCYDTPHNDRRYFKKLDEYDKKYFPELLKQTSEYSVHEYIAHSTKGVAKFESLVEYFRKKYNFNNFGIWQCGKRKDNGELICFDYGLEWY